VDQAWAVAGAVAGRLGLRVEELESLVDYGAAIDLLQGIWRPPDSDPIMTRGIMRSIACAGGYLAGAYRDGSLVGAAIGFFGHDDDHGPHLHSFIAGVAPGAQGRGVGNALKQHQRAWTLARGVGEIWWTFDPLVRRNAYFNLHKLGGRPAAYLRDFYGEMTDGINAGDRTDRLHLRWELGHPRVVAAAGGDPGDVDAAALRAAGAQVLVDRDGERPAAAGAPPTAARVLVAVPADIEDLRGRAPGTALDWRLAVRDALTGALDAGYRFAGIDREGFYVLERQ